MWEAFKDAIFFCIQFFYNFVSDWGLAIIIVTLILRLIMFPSCKSRLSHRTRCNNFSHACGRYKKSMQMTNSDRLRNFRRSMQRLDLTPLQAAFLYWFRCLSLLRFFKFYRKWAEEQRAWFTPSIVFFLLLLIRRVQYLVKGSAVYPLWHSSFTVRLLYLPSFGTSATRNK